MIPIIDTHTHLQFPDFDPDREAVLERARAAGVVQVITLGTDLASSREALAIAERHPMVFAAAGIHPSEAHLVADGDVAAIDTLIREHSRIRAVGEIGLDFYWETEHWQAQYAVFGSMLDLAKGLDYPVVIHNRSAQREMEWFFQEAGIASLNGVMHCFEGEVADARFYLDMGLHISFTGNITFRSFRDEAVVRLVPLDRLLLETDSPFITPAPHRGGRNEPAFVGHVAARLAAIHGVPEDEIRRITTANARRLFGLPDPGTAPEG